MKMNRAAALYHLMRLGAWVTREYIRLPQPMADQMWRESGLIDTEGRVDPVVAEVARSLATDLGEQTPITGPTLRDLVKGGVLDGWRTRTLVNAEDRVEVEFIPKGDDRENVYVATTADGPVVQHSVSNRRAWVNLNRPGVTTIEGLTVFLDSIIEASRLKR